MAGICELNSFVHKFRNLWKAGHTASLKIEARAGEAWVELHVGLGVPHPVQGEQQHHGNSRQRRREKRAAARAEESESKAADNAATDGQVVEKVPDRDVEKQPVAEEANEINEALNHTVQVNIANRVMDEFENENSISEEEFLDSKIRVAPSGLCDWKDDDYIKNLVFKNLVPHGIRVKNIEIGREKRGYFEASFVEIEPTARKQIQDLKLGLRNWTVEPWES